MTPEREIVERAVARLDGVWRLHVRLRTYNWVRENFEAVRGFQEAIGKMSEFDIVIAVLWKRIGSPLRPDMFLRSNDTAYESGTVFEIETALESAASPAGKPRVFIFKKTVRVTYSAENVESEKQQYQALDNWWRRIAFTEEGHSTRGYAEFETLEELERRVESLIETDLRQRRLIPEGPAWDVVLRGSPYRGLYPYDADHSEVFFGRGLAIAAALEELSAAAQRDAPVLFVVGPSGSGKSSLVRAGLLPLFSGHQQPGVDFWRHLVWEPAQDPFMELARRLYSAVPELAASPQPTPEHFARLARQSPEDAAHSVRWALAEAAAAAQRKIGGGQLPVGRLLVVLDQLETVIDCTAIDGSDDEQQQTAAECRGFTALVRALVESETTWGIATLRSDRYPDLQLDPNLLELRRRGAMYDLPPPGLSEITDIIKGPARAAGLTFETLDGVSLVTEINKAVCGEGSSPVPDALPLLQMTLSRLFDAASGNVLTYTAYRKIGGFDGAIAAHAEAAFAEVSPAGQISLDGVLRALVSNINERERFTLRTPNLSEAAKDAGSIELVDKLDEARILVKAEGGLRVAHEALLRRWERARTSPALQPEALQLRRQIEPGFAAWQKSKADNDLLRPGTNAIAAAEAILRDHPGAFPPELERYVQRSIEAAAALQQIETKRARRRALIATTVSAALAVLVVLALGLYGFSRRNLSLALLTKAHQFVINEEPTRGFVIANAATGLIPLPGYLGRLLASDVDADREIEARTMATVAAPAIRLPESLLMIVNDPKAIAFSPDGKRIAVGDNKGQVLLADTTDHRNIVALVGHTSFVEALKFGPDGKWLATASDDKTIRLWNLDTKESRILCGHRGEVTDVVFDPRGRFLASASYDGHVMVWNATTFTNMRDFTLTRPDGTPGGRVFALDVSSDGAMLAAADESGDLDIRDTSNWQPNRIETGRPDLVGVAFAPDGRFVATGSLEGPIDIWNVSTHKRLGSLDEFPNKLWRVRFSPDGRLFGAAAWDGTARLWSSDEFRGVPQFHYAGTIDANDHWVNDIAFSKDSTLLATAGESGAVRIWRVGGIRPMLYSVKDDQRETLAGAYSRDGTKFVTGGREGLARLYRATEAGNLVYVCPARNDDWVFAVDFTQDGTSIIAAGNTRGKPDNTIRIFDGSDCTPKQAISIGRASVKALAVSPDGVHFAWSEAADRGAIWLVTMTPEVRQIRLPDHHSGQVTSLDFSPDGKSLVSAGRDGRIAVWNLAELKVQDAFPLQSKPVLAVKYSPDGKLIASAGVDSQVLLWDPRRVDTPVSRFFVRSEPIGRLAFSSDGSRLAVGAEGRFISAWSLRSGEKDFELDALVGVRGVFGFNPKRGDLAYDGESGMVRILPSNPGSGIRADQLGAVLKGTDVFFDQIPSNLPTPITPLIDAQGSACLVQ